MGGTAAFLSACRLPGLSAAVAFYGGQVGKFADEKPKCPLQMHFGEKDESIPMDVVDDIKEKQPQAETYLSGRGARLFLRRTRQLPQGGRPTSPGAGHRVPGEKYEVTGKQRAGFLPLIPSASRVSEDRAAPWSGTPLARGRTKIE